MKFGVDFCLKNNGLILCYQSLIKDCDSQLDMIIDYLELNDSIAWKKLSKELINTDVKPFGNMKFNDFAEDEKKNIMDFVSLVNKNTKYKYNYP